VVVGDEYDDQPRPVHHDLSRTDLVRERVRLVMPADHPLARRRKVPLTELGAQPWAACQPGTGHREMQIRICRQLGGFEPDLRYSSDDFLILLELVRTTGACALLPDLVLGYESRESGPGVVVRDLAEGTIGRTVYMLTRIARTPAVGVVTETIESVSRRRSAPRRGG
jgi:DNA-binding transcriptional LysR family regulator